MSSEVVVVAIVTAREGSADAAEELLRGVIPPTHEEDGCLAFALHRDPADAQRFVLIERWASREALDRHLASDHIAAFVARLGEVRDAPTQVLVLDPVPVGDPAKGILGGS
jgi:quinol monooxygenase YgiN